MDAIKEALLTMRVPEGRIADYRWLLRNLGINNSDHPRFHEVMKALKKEVMEARGGSTINQEG